MVRTVGAGLALAVLAHVATAQSTTIYRDAWGVPHIHGRTAADAAYGFGYTTAQDYWPRLAENYLRATGQWARVIGESGFRHDYLNRALQITRLAQSEYRASSREIRALCDGYARGVNQWLADHPDGGRALARVEPWYPFALIKYLYFQQGFLGAAGVDRRELTLLTPTDTAGRASFGSNGWAIAPRRTRDGHALLFINPHLPWFGPGQVIEAHVMSDDGWNFTGYARAGFPFPYVGHNATLGWVSTDNAADLADSWTEIFDDPRDPLAYRHGARYRRAVTWTDSVAVRIPAGVEWRRVTLRKTHHGPIVAGSAERPTSVGLSGLERNGWLAEWYAMTRAKDVSQLRSAMRPLAVQFGNVMAADRGGNIWYLYNGAVPRRDSSFDWSKTVDGSDPRTDWRGVHRFEDLPALLNPASGWMQNSNTTPSVLNDDTAPLTRGAPPYMVGEGDNPRGVRGRDLLRAESRWTFESLQRAAFDTRVVMADSLLPRWLGVIAPLAARDPLLATLRDTLRQWNRRADADQVGMTLFAEWTARLGGQFPVARDEQLGPALLAAADSLRGAFGRWQVRWGDRQRIDRRRDTSDGVFDLAASLPLPGAPGQLGAIFTTYAGATSGARFGFLGATYVSVVEFGPTVRGVSLHVFGASGDPSSSHYRDQAARYVSGGFKPSPFTLAEVRRAAVDSLVLRPPNGR